MITTIQEMLNEEKWTRATINSYTIANFEELDKLLETKVEKKELDDLKDLCDEHLIHTKHSIIALYLSGITSLEKHLIDDSNLLQLIALFSDNKKWNIVEFLSNRILSYGENKSALRNLAECYENLGKEDEKFAVWERLIKVDYEETDIIRSIAEKYEENGDIDAALVFYKKGMHRFINKKNFSQIKDLWVKFLEYCPQDFDYFMNVAGRVSKFLQKDRAAQLLDSLLSYYRDQEDWDKSILILKEILTNQPSNSQARNVLIDCYRQKFANHSKLEDYIIKSNLTQSFRDVHSAIADFEKHISFDKGTFVYHKTWGIGRIQEIKNDKLLIDFATKRNHSMSLQMAVNALTVLLTNHIWVIKSVFPRERLNAKVKSDVQWALRTIILSFDNSAGMKQIKSELVPSILSSNEWISWNTNAKKILKTDPLFGINPDNPDEFVIRETPVSYEEKALNIFKAERDFYQKIKLIRDFLQNSDPESDFFAEMFSYFVSIMKSYTTVTDSVISSYLLIKRLEKKYPFLHESYDTNMEDIITQIDSIENVFNNIQDTELKRAFLEEIIELHSNWDSVLKSLFPYYMSSFIIDELNSHGKKDTIKQLFLESYSQYKDKQEIFLWLVKNYSRNYWENKIGVSFEKILIALLHLLDLTYRAISSKRDVSANRKSNKLISSILFEDKIIQTFFQECDKDSAIRVFSLLKDISDLDPSIRIEVKHFILERFPDFEFHDKNDRTQTVSGGLLVTAAKFDEKQKKLQQILEVEIPQNSKEIGEARLLGDLKENAEYIAGKEKQGLLNIAANKLKIELDKAVIFRAKEIDTSKISFGTKVTLLNNNTNQEEEISILGPWESEPSLNIISYLAPFGAKLLNHVVGDSFDFIINEREYSYTVKEIVALDF